MKTIIRNFCIDNDIPFLERLNLFEDEYDENEEENKITVVHQTVIQSEPPK